MLELIITVLASNFTQKPKLTKVRKSIPTFQQPKNHYKSVKPGKHKGRRAS